MKVAPSLIFVLATMNVVAEAEESSNPSPITNSEKIAKGSPMGNLILLAVVGVVGLMYAYVAWCEKMKSHKARTTEPIPSLPPPRPSRADWCAAMRRVQSSSAALSADRVYQDLIENEDRKKQKKVGGQPGCTLLTP